MAEAVDTPRLDGTTDNGHEAEILDGWAADARALLIKPPKSRAMKQEVDTIEIKDDPDTTLSADNQATSAHTRRRNVKDEEPEYVKIDLTLPELNGEEDIFEDVDEDEIVDLTYEGIAHVDGVRHFVCEGFKIRQIPEPFIVKRSLNDLFRCVESGSILLDPDYQREVVWDETRAALLVTSILMGYFIPPIIFNVKKNVVKVGGREEERFVRTCVDGKQRLTSIWRFMKGQIGFNDTNSAQKKWYFCHPVIDGRIQISNRNVLPNAVKKHFESQFFCCYEYEELTKDTEETMFQLVQRGIALAPAEKMRSMSTAWAAYTRQYEDDYALIVNLSKQNRASGFRLVLTILIMIQEVMASKKEKRYNSKNAFPILQASPQALLRQLHDQQEMRPSMKTKFKTIFDRYESLVKLSSTQVTATRWRVNTNSVFDASPAFLRQAKIYHVRTFSPFELVIVAVLVTVHKDHRTDMELLEDVKFMRIYLRQKHRDLRVNAQCWTTAWQYITDEMDIRRASSASLHPSIEGVTSSGGNSSCVDGSDTISELSSAPSSPEPEVRPVKKARPPPRVRKPLPNGKIRSIAAIAKPSKANRKRVRVPTVRTSRTSKKSKKAAA